MKKALLLFVILSFVFSFSSCKKEKASSVFPGYVDGLLIEMDYQLSDLTPDKGVVIAGYKNEVPCLLRVNSDGFLMWKKEFPQIQGQLTGIAITDQAIYISSSVDESIWTGYDSTYNCAHGFFYTYQIKFCELRYEYSSSFDFVPNIEVNGTSYLNKISLNGAYELSKSFEGNTILNSNNNDVLSTYENGDLAFMCLDHYGYIPEELVMSPIYDRVDSVKYHTSKDQVNLFRLDADGNTIWTRAIDQIQTNFYLSEYKPVYNYNIRTSEDYTAVSLNNKVVIFNNNGDSISTINQEAQCSSSIGQSILLNDKFIYVQDYILDSKVLITNMEGLVLDEITRNIHAFSQPLGNENILTAKFVNDQILVYALDDKLNVIHEKALTRGFMFHNLLSVDHNTFYLIEESISGLDQSGFNYNRYFLIKKEHFNN